MPSSLPSASAASSPPAPPSPSRQRQVLGELPLHIFVAQSLLPASPVAKPKSRPTSRSVSPHKQAILHSHQHHRAQSARRSSSSFSQAPPSSSSSASPSSPLHPSSLPASHSRRSHPPSDHNMTTLEATPVRRKLFDVAPGQSPSSAVPLEHSPILPAAPLYLKVPASISRSLAAAAAETDRSPSTSVKPRTPSRVRSQVAAGSAPVTPTDAPTTPKNARLHRPCPVSGPKPKDQVEPSPSTERNVENFLQARWTSAQKASVSRPMTPVPVHDDIIEAAPQPDRDAANADGGDGDNNNSVEGAVALSSSSTSPRKTSTVQSLPKKKFRVSKTEVAIAHEIAGSGPMGSPSPCKVASFADGGYFAAAAAGAGGRSQSETYPVARSSDGFPQRRRLQPLDADEYALPDAMGNNVFSSAHFRRLSASNLFGDIKRSVSLRWTVYEDPFVNDTQIGAKAATVPPTQDLAPSPSSTSAISAPSTPNKENKRPRLDIEAETKPGVEASSPSRQSARKRGTGGRLSLLANAEEDHVDADLAATTTAVSTSTKTTTNQPKEHSDFPVQAVAHRSPETVRGRTPRKVSMTSAGAAMTRKLAAAAVVAKDEGVASRTRSKARTTV